MASNLLLSLPVMLGGALGAICRVKGDSAIMAAMGGHFPLGILCINMTGSFLMGLLMGVLSHLKERLPAPEGDTSLSFREEVAAWLGAFFGTGFLGGFTTFSSFALDTVRLWQIGHTNFALLNIGLNAVLCIALAGLGWMLTAHGEEQA